jgi:hypothetical protein
MDARKAHRFVAMNAEDMARRILMLSGAPEEEVEASLKQIGAQIQAYRADEAKRAALQPVSEAKKQ